MGQIRLPRYLFILTVIFVFVQSDFALDPSSLITIRRADTMSPTLEKFIQSLNISNAQAQDVLESLEENESTVLALEARKQDRLKLTTSVCNALKIVLGPEQVNTGAIDDALLQRSWYDFSPDLVVPPSL